MVNLVVIQKPLLHGLMHMAGTKQYAVEVEPGTVISFWVPSETIKRKPKKGEYLSPADVVKPSKTAVVLVHGFATEGVVTWLFQVGALTKKYAVYVPDLVFFGGSTSTRDERSPAFQAECLVMGLRKLGVEKCTIVGFSYGGMVAFKMGELYPEFVHAIVISGSILAMTDSLSHDTLHSLGFSSSKELLLPTNLKGLKALHSVAMYRKFWFPDRFHKDFLEVMFTNRKERAELLEGLIVSNKDETIPSFSQRIHMLWGEKDRIFKVELAQKLKEKLGENATVECIKKAGHLVHLERPCIYNRCLKQFLASLHKMGAKK
ncbi:hypothetical protein SAY87_005738 [Trapa incisa]|uniref:AB hydrolase-1 domain-containing protein n=1 Tax=Trapa incisa TaxID=236973 RepID=A0AAN7K594_9MYRT|nr:hypothetical protein SAY87_005738 [Trapa incisa]